MIIKRLFCSIAVVISVLMLGSCGDSKPRNIDTSDSSESKIVNNEQNDQAASENEEFTTPDLSFFDVHGHVKTIQYKDDTDVIEYSEDGSLLTIGGKNRCVEHQLNDPDDYYYTRNGKGEIEECQGWEYMTGYIWKDGRLAGYSDHSEGEVIDVTNVYEGNKIVKVLYVLKEGDMDTDESEWAEVENTTYNMTYLKTDSHGNWLKRERNGDITERTITYY